MSSPITPALRPESRGRLVSVAILFFLSGFAGLVYQVLWMRELGLLFGSTSHAAATTTAAFFLGIGTGSAFFGERGKLSHNPLRTYGLLELGVSGSALLYFGLLATYRKLYPGLFIALSDNSAGFLAVKFALGMAILFPPAFFMGGTLPVITRFLTKNRRREALGRCVPVFYGINTIGAAAGTLSAGFFLPIWIGTSNSYWLAVGTTALTGLAALVLAHKDTTSAAQPAPESSTAKAEPGIPKSIVGLAFFSGFSTIALEVLWTRMFSQTLHNSVYSYAVILVTFLVALSIGSWIAAWLARRYTSNAQRVMPWLLLIAGVLSLVSPMLFHEFGSNGGRTLGGTSNWFGYLRLIFFAAGVSVLPATIALGVIFPFLLKLSESHVGEDAGQVVGRLAAINTGGAVLGSLAAGFLLLDLIGLWASIRLMAICYFILVFAFARWPDPEDTLRRRFSREVILATAAVVAALTILDPAHLPVVSYSPLKRAESIVQIDEGSDATVAVIRRRNALRIKVNNSYVLGDTASAVNERMQAHLPLLVHPSPDNVFFLGLGTGITAGGALQVDGIKKLTAAELLPSVIRASETYFDPWLNGLFSDERVRIVAEDGRNYLAGSNETFDVIVADLFTPWRIGVGGLYTVEHYTTAANRLAPNGIYAQWLPLYQLTEDQFASITNSMRQVFPEITVWRGDFYGEKSIICLIGHRDSAKLDWAAFTSRTERMNDKLGVRHGDLLEGLPQLLTYYAGNLTGTEIYADAKLNPDEFPRVEYEAPIAQRAAMAGEVPWFYGTHLMTFFDALQKATPHENDPFLKDIPWQYWRLVDAGHLLHELRVAESTKDLNAIAEIRKQMMPVMRDLNQIPKGNQAGPHSTRN
jgi:spermidine synthase